MPEHLPSPSADVSALRRFSEVKLIVADLDGTLFPSELSGTTQRLLRQLRPVGVRLTVATGRTFRGVQDLLVKLQGTHGHPLIKRDIPLILYNGSVLVEAGTGQLLKCNNMILGSLPNILQIAKRYPCEVYAYSCDQDVLNQGVSHAVRERVLGWQYHIGLSRADYEFNGLPVEWEPPRSMIGNHLPCAVVIKSSEPQVLEALARELESIESIGITSSSSAYRELRPRDSNKGVAVKWVAHRLGLSADEVLAVGDNDNDIEMLQWAGIGVAVSTASPRAKQCADFLCDFGPFQGVVQVLRLVHEAHRYYRSARKDHIKV